MPNVTVEALKTKSDFDKALSKDKKVVVFFSATWCPPCKQVTPIFNRLANNTNIAFYKVDVDENAETATYEEVTAMPTFKFFINGVEIEELTFEGTNQETLTKNLKTFEDGNQTKSKAVK